MMRKEAIRFMGMSAVWTGGGQASLESRRDPGEMRFQLSWGQLSLLIKTSEP